MNSSSPALRRTIWTRSNRVTTGRRTSESARKEVARILELPNAKAVYNRVYRALAALRERLREVGYLHAADL